MTVAAMMLLCAAGLVAWIELSHMAWRYRNPADLIGRRCIALTGMDVTLDGPLDLIRLSPVHAVLKYRGIGLHVIDCDLRHHTNKTSDGIRAVVITEGKP